MLARAAARGEVCELPGVTVANASVAFQMFNAAFLSAPVLSEPEMNASIGAPRRYFRDRRQEWAYWVCDGWLGAPLRRRMTQIFRRHDLYPAVELPGMIADSVLPPARPLPRLEIRRVCDYGTRALFCQIGSVCFNVPLAWFLEVFENESIWSDFAGYVGYVGGVAVCTAASVVAAGVNGIYNVATLPEYQRHGYGEAVMRHALEETRARTGIERTILQATPQGLKIYERMGYRTVTRVAVFSS